MKDKKGSQQITARFIQVCTEIVAMSKINKGRYSTRRALCDSIGLSYPQFNHYENGQNVTVENIFDIVKVHGVNPAWLITGKGNKFAAPGQTKDIELVLAKLERIELRISALESSPKKRMKLNTS